MSLDIAAEMICSVTESLLLWGAVSANVTICDNPDSVMSSCPMKSGPGVLHLS